MVSHDEIDAVTRTWRQGDFTLTQTCIYRLSGPPNSGEIKESPVRGLAVLTNTCDIVRTSRDRPYIEVCALFDWPADRAKEMIRVRRGLFRRYAYVPGAADLALVADLEQTMTVEKSILTTWKQSQGCVSDEERREFSRVVGQKRARPAFRDEFSGVARPLRDWLDTVGKSGRRTNVELDWFREIRVLATPDWNADSIELFFLFILSDDSPAFDEGLFLQEFEEFVRPVGPFVSVSGMVYQLADLRADEFVYSDRLEYDDLSL